MPNTDQPPGPDVPTQPHPLPKPSEPGTLPPDVNPPRPGTSPEQPAVPYPVNRARAAAPRARPTAGIRLTALPPLLPPPLRR